LREDAINFLKVLSVKAMTRSLARNTYNNVIYAGHPYGHHNEGKISSLEKMTSTMCAVSTASHFTRANLVIGLAGGYPKGFEEKVDADFAKLPEGRDKKHFDNRSSPLERISISSRATRDPPQISLGFPIEVTRRR